MIAGFSLARKQPNKIGMKHLLLTAIAAVVLVRCGDSVSHKEFNGLHLIFVLIPQNIVFLWALRSRLI